MSIADDARFWNRTARKYAEGRIADEAGYERTLERTRGLLRPEDSILELGCGTGTTAIRLAGGVKDYLATDISTDVIAIAQERKHAAGSLTNLVFSIATVETFVPHPAQFNAVLGFNYLHLVRDLPGTLQHIHSLLAPQGLFVTKTPCVGDMNPLIRLHPCVAGDARNRQGTLCRRLHRLRAWPAYTRRRFRYSGNGNPCHKGQRQAPLYRGAQKVS